ncbi:tetratricopeptide repeat protein [Urbifossiella limnaea]|uniref:Photosystem I assembly protein Ycf3 n=1 Tax=Urbifossiella limnaea TaxID=2528023 RepID=A0A517XLZ4_9BACT|nr:tetratricopeptide repeat protein [Urbifossiella limnaea]QDU18524.1 photosystem I assembly protein Ycf3 [Urbifossiella limnaea]
MRPIALLITALALPASGCLTAGGGGVPAWLAAKTDSPLVPSGPTGPASAAPPKATELAPNESAALTLAMAEGLEKDGKDADAAACYERARQLDPSVADRAAHRLAILYDRNDEQAKAMAEFTSLLKKRPRDAALLCDVGYSHYNRGRWAEAEVHLRKAVAADRTSKRAWNNLGLALAMQGKEREALECFEKAVTPAEAQANLGFCLAVQGKRDEAKAAYQRALNLEPALRMAQAALARLEAPPTAPGAGLTLPDVPPGE